MFSEMEKYFQDCKQVIESRVEEPNLHFLLGDIIPDEEMEYLMLHLNSLDAIDQWSGYAPDSEFFSTKLSLNEMWWHVKNKSETISLSFREYEYEMFKESIGYSIDFKNHDGNGMFMIKNTEMNELMDFFKSLRILHLD
jgi:hypothetical protein